MCKFPPSQTLNDTEIIAGLELDSPRESVMFGGNQTLIEKNKKDAQMQLLRIQLLLAKTPIASNK